MRPAEKDLDLKFFAKAGRGVTFKKGETILRPGEDPTGIYYIKKGLARLYSISASGQEITFNILKPGSYLFMMWALSEIENSYFFEALTELETLKAPKETILEFIKSQPDLLYKLNKRTMIGLEASIATTQTLLLGKADSKIAAIFIMLAKRFGKNGKNNQIVIQAPLTHRLIATLAGLTRETASLEIEKLQKAKIISKKQRFFVVNKIKILESKLEVDPPKSSSLL
ncbi:MAG: hypothetical protein UU34_C0004G0012 [Candidatus Curtissbacteria bacterium GW2011_GWA1_41_11]|uniref:Transcriptional regulator, Crp/Fnr family n=1 Tax=Candidatus Curtissbacteria bacterium GW2011_GWA1_41_11 TaxID=1618409 RepID=A0A0G0UIW2_9BACT|nr:MAG: hypothetical protein UU34_C0004G0012 [Candidatus Curtissbacteria bacterium GW2011_GWA1_41_11]